jgi:hypothetical protein
MNTLSQKYFLTTNYFEIRDKGLFVSLKSFSSRFEEEILFEEISNRVTRTAKKETVLVFFSSAFALAGLLSLLRGSVTGFIVLLIIALLFLLLLKISIQNLVNLYIHGDKTLQIKADKPNAQEVEDFLETLKKVKKDYLISKYGKIDKDLPIEGQMNNLIWLKNLDYLSEEEFLEMKGKLLGKENGNKIGFK